MQDSLPQIPIIVIRDYRTISQYSPAFENPYLAYVITNPDLRASGKTEEDAIKHLKSSIINRFAKGNFVRMAHITLEELIIESVHES